MKSTQFAVTLNIGGVGTRWYDAARTCPELRRNR